MLGSKSINPPLTKGPQMIYVFFKISCTFISTISQKKYKIMLRAPYFLILILASLVSSSYSFAQDTTEFRLSDPFYMEIDSANAFYNSS